MHIKSRCVGKECGGDEKKEKKREREAKKEKKRGERNIS
jgi:hypothetical protein